MRGKPVTFDDFVGGLNTQSAPYDVDAREARDARNVVATVRGAVRKRYGSTQLAVPPATLKGLFAGHTPDALIGTSQSAIYGISSGGTVTTLKSAMSDAPWEWVQAPASGGQGPYYGINASNTPQQWNGAAAATSDWTAATGAVPNGKFIVYAGNRLWVAGVPGFPSRVYWCEVGDPRNWPAANVTDFDPNDGESITGLGVIGPYVIVFKQNKAWRIYDLDDSSNDPIGQGAGCVSHRSIATAPSGLYFLSGDHGVMVTDGQTMRPVSDKIKPTVDSIIPGNRALASGAHDAGHYYLAISTTGTANNLVLDLDVGQGSWWIHTLPVAQFAVWQPGSNDPELYAPRTDTARVDRLFVDGTYSDASAAYVSYWTGPFLTFGAPHLAKRCRRIHFDGKGRIAVSITKDFRTASLAAADTDFTGNDGLWAVDDGSLWAVDDGTTWLGSMEIDEAFILTPGTARAWSLTFGNDTTEAWEVESYTMLMQQRSR